MLPMRTTRYSILLYISTAVLVAPLFWPVIVWCFNDLNANFCEDVGKAIGYSGGLLLFIPWGICALAVYIIAIISLIRKRRRKEPLLTQLQNNVLLFAVLLVVVEICLAVLSAKLPL